MTFATRQALGKRIQTLRKENNLSQEKLALMVNVERSYLAKLELGKRNASIDCIEKIAGGFDLSLSELFEGVDRERKEDARNPKGPHVNYGLAMIPPDSKN